MTSDVDSDRAVPMAAPTTAPVPPIAVLGTAPGQPELEPASAPKRSLVAPADVLPELSEAPAAPRPLWKHPAFIVSIIVTFLAIAAMVTILILGLIFGGQAKVSGLELETTSGNAHLTWQGPDVPYSVFIVDGSGTASDVSQLVRGGHEAWIPVGLGYYDADSCFVVRPAESTEKVELGAEALDAQGAQSVCMADAAP